MERTVLAKRQLPNYTKGEERFNAISHFAGSLFGIIALVCCLAVSSAKHDTWGIVGGSIYGASLILLYTMSGIYHGLQPSTAKKVMQIIDHCTIYFLIGGSYTPIIFSSIRLVSPVSAWILFGIVWGFAILGTVFTAIDLKKYSLFSMICYIGMGWCVVLEFKTVLKAIGTQGFLLLIVGGVIYTLGAVLYCLGKKHKYMHAVFHVFVLIGSILQFFCIFDYVLQ